MINFLRKLRNQPAGDAGKFSDGNPPVGRAGQFLKYSRYAIGEIVLVVVGILIALQINNWNEHQKELEKEINYLHNVKKDLSKAIEQIDAYIVKRESQIISSRLVLEHFEGKPVDDPSIFNKNAINVYTWRKFFLSLNTYKELTNSGNLSLISNDSIKNGLLDLEELYQVMKDEEDHFRFDAENLLYLPQFETTDMNPLVKNYTYHVTDGKQGENVDISDEIQTVLDDIRQKNGFVMAAYEFDVLNSYLLDLKQRCQDLIILIDKDIN